MHGGRTCAALLVLVTILVPAAARTAAAETITAATYDATPTTGLGSLTPVNVSGATLPDGWTSVSVAQCLTGLTACSDPQAAPVDAASHSFTATFPTRSIITVSSPFPTDNDCRRDLHCELRVFGPGPLTNPVATFPLTFIPPSRFHPLPPTRILDSRTGAGGWSTPLGPGETRRADVGGHGGVPATGVSSVVLNVTAADIEQASHLVVWSAGSPQPDTSNLNTRPGDPVAAMVTTAIDGDGRVDVFNNSGHVAVIIDVAGWFDDGTGGGDGYTPLLPSRLFDSRSGPGATPVTAGQPRTVPVRGIGGVPSGATAVAVTLTGVVPSQATHLTAWPTGVPMPGSSTLNLLAGDLRANAAIVPIGADSSVRIATNSGATDVVLDVMGWFGPSGRYGFTAVAPQRKVDTRIGLGPKPGPGQTVIVDTIYWGPFPKPSGGLLVNTTLLTHGDDTFLTLYWDGLTNPRTVSNVNARGDGRVAPAEALVGQNGDLSAIALYNNQGHPDVLMDFVGFFS